MLRRIYRCVLRLHPPGFRRRFGDQMLSIFDQIPGKLCAVRLLLDGFVSLTRQWALRPEFWNEISSAPARQGALYGLPSFSTLDPFRPRPGAVIHGVILTATLFTLTCFAIRYSWIHVLDVHIPAIEFETLSNIHPNVRPAEFRGAPDSPAVKDVPGARPQPDGAPAHLYVEPMPVEAEITPSPTTPSELHLKGISAAPNRPALAQVTIGIRAESYAGTYVSDSPRLKISIAIRSDQLVMDIVGRHSRSLSPLSENTFAVAGESSARIEFSSPRGGKFHRLQLSQSGMQITAERQ